MTQFNNFMAESNKYKKQTPVEPIAFNPASHPSWMEERENFASKWGTEQEWMDEFHEIKVKKSIFLDRSGNEVTGDDGITGKFVSCTFRYTRPLGLLAVFHTEQGYLNENYVYLCQFQKERTQFFCTVPNSEQILGF